MAELGEANIGGRMVPAWILNGNASAIDFFESIDYPGCIYRKLSDGTVEWVNPPMAIGVEYRTIERYFGKPVYTKLIDFGALPNATSKTISGYAGNVSSVVDFGGMSRYFGQSLSNAGFVTLSASQEWITIACTADLSAGSAEVWVKYTKTTN